MNPQPETSVPLMRSVQENSISQPASFDVSPAGWAKQKYTGMVKP